jgi:hypothetical protein
MDQPMIMYKCEICLACYSRPRQCHARATIRCECKGGDCRKPPTTADGQLKTREPRWWVEARNEAQSGRE